MERFINHYSLFLRGVDLSWSVLHISFHLSACLFSVWISWSLLTLDFWQKNMSGDCKTDYTAWLQYCTLPEWERAILVCLLIVGIHFGGKYMYIRTSLKTQQNCVNHISYPFFFYRLYVIFSWSLFSIYLFYFFLQDRQMTFSMFSKMFIFKD